MTVKQAIQDLAKTHGFERSGVVKLSRPLSMDFYESWIQQGLHGSMNYLKDHIPAKADPTRLLAQAKSAIVVAVDYVPHPEPEVSDLQDQLNRLSVALYARGKDYHHWLKKKLDRLKKSLEAQFPGDQFLCFTDSQPVLERDLAHRAGLGWVGKNTCLIDERRGSFFLIGEIYSTMMIEAELDLPPDRCGTCTRCLDACPTNALIEPRKLDARKCISYWTIESKSVGIESQFGEIANLGSHYFGCDICQAVCPWNRKVVATTQTPSPQANAEADFRWILSCSNRELEKHFQTTSLNRLRGYQHRRNALYVIHNLRLKELLPEVQRWKDDPRLGMLASEVETKLLEEL